MKKVRNFLIGGVGALAIRLIAPTLRIKVEDASNLVSHPKQSTPVIFVFWHNRMFLMPYLYRRFIPGRHAICLVSVSQDGEMIARVLEHFGLGAVRGSSSRRGKEAFRELTEHLKKGWDVAITPDGPRGPCYQAHLGVVGLASLSGCPVVPVTYHVKWNIELPTWDRFIIPLPFSSCRLSLGKMMHIAETVSDESLEKKRQFLEDCLRSL